MTFVPPSSPNVRWIDEELRKEKAIVDDLRDTVAKQEVILVDQSQRILALEDRLAKLQAQTLRIPEVEESLQHTRDEIALMLSELREGQQKRETEFLRNRQAEREQDKRAVQEMGLELQRLNPLEQALVVRQAEGQRLNEAVLRLQQDLEDGSKRLAQADESGRQLSDTIQKIMTEIGQSAVARQEMLKAQKEDQSRLTSLEDGFAKATRLMSSLEEMRKELTGQQQELLETLRRADHSRVQTMTEWERRLEGYTHQVGVWSDQLRFFNAQHDKNRRVLRQVQGIAQEVSQQQDQLRQLQRIGEEQLRRELGEWRSENDHRWAQEVDRREHEAEAQMVRDEAQDERLAKAEQSQQDTLEVISTLAERVTILHDQLERDIERFVRLEQTLWQAVANATQDALENARNLGSQEQ
jgi:hypothetical protein